MATNDIVQTIAEARIDARSLSEFMYKPASFMVSRRLSPPINTLEFFLNYFNSINSTYQASAKTVNDAVNQAHQSVIAADALIATNANTAAQAVEAAIEGVAIDANLISDALLTTVPIAGTGGAVRTQLSKNRENISVMDFFTEAELAAYNSYNPGLARTNFDAYRPLQAFFDYISVNDVGTAYCNGIFGTSQGIIVGGAKGAATKNIVGCLVLYAINLPTEVIDTMLTFWVGGSFTWSGQIQLTANGSIAFDYDKRKVNNGIRIGGIYPAIHCKFPPLFLANGFKHWGVIMDNLTTGTIIEKIKVSRAGSGYVTGTYKPSLESNFVVTETIPTVNTQRSILQLDNFVDTREFAGIVYAYINDELYYVFKKEIDLTGNTLAIFPRLPTGVESGKLRFVFGGGFLTRGGDASVTRIGNINMSSTSTAVSLEALYPPVIEAITTQGNFIALSIAGSLSAGNVGGSINQQYFEANTYDIIQNTKFNANLVMHNNVALSLSKCKHMGNHRTSAENIDTLYPLTIRIAGETGKALEPVFSTVTSNYSLDMSSEIDVTHLTGKVATTVNVVLGNMNTFRLLGQRSKTLHYYNGKGGVAPKLTIIPPLGTTINGKSILEITGYVGAITVELFLFQYTEFNAVIRGEKYIPAIKTNYTMSLAVGEQKETTFTLTGANIGDIINVSLDTPLLGTQIWAEVVSANTVKVYHRNGSASEYVAAPRVIYLSVTPKGIE